MDEVQEVLDLYKFELEKFGEELMTLERTKRIALMDLEVINIEIMEVRERLRKCKDSDSLEFHRLATEATLVAKRSQSCLDALRQIDKDASDITKRMKGVQHEIYQKMHCVIGNLNGGTVIGEECES